jgi:ribosomal protein S18 acetylase RimI-like enzyme
MSRSVSVDDAESVAGLMLRAYRGTVDDEGEGPEEALAAVKGLLAGAYGPFDFSASEVVLREDIIAATLVTEYQGVALVAFSMTDPAWQRRGLARSGLLRVCARLRAAGRERVDLAVTAANTRAIALYRSLGFVEVG